jgi:hypothetical protein
VALVACGVVGATSLADVAGGVVGAVLGGGDGGEAACGGDCETGDEEG